MKTIQFLVAITAVSLTSSCSSTPPVSTIADTTSLASVKSGESALIVIDVNGQGCERTNFALKNLDTNESQNVSIVQKRGEKFLGMSLGEPALVAVPAGTYKIISGSCINSGYVPIGYTWIDRWFDPFEVKSGEARYLGSLSVSAAKGKGKQTTTDEVVTRILGLGFNKNRPVQYPVFRFVELKSRAKRAVDQNYPELTSELKFGPPKARFSAKEFRDVVQDAFALDADGKQPLKKDAAQKVRDFMEDYKD
jgi:hypothetical protein